MVHRNPSDNHCNWSNKLPSVDIAIRAQLANTMFPLKGFCTKTVDAPQLKHTCKHQAHKQNSSIIIQMILFFICTGISFVSRYI